MKSPIPKERLRVSNWIVQKLYNYAVKERVVIQPAFAPSRTRIRP